MAHNSINIGKRSELLAQTALLANGYEVAQPIAPETYDLVARDPITGSWATFQVKTARIREDRGAAVVVAKRSDGSPYTRQDADYLIGVVGNDVFLIENTGQGEYWTALDGIRWKRLSLDLIRGGAAV